VREGRGHLVEELGGGGQLGVLRVGVGGGRIGTMSSSSWIWVRMSDMVAALEC